MKPKNKTANPARCTKIVCTIGPACSEEKQLEAMVRAGMNVCRLNFSHGTHENHAELIQKIRRVAKKTGQPIALLQDLQGPKIRVGELPKEGIKLPTGSEITFTSGKTRLPHAISVSYPSLAQDVKVGQHLLFDDGLLQAKVKRIKGNDVLCEMEFGGTLFSHKGLNLPDTQTSIPAMTEKDKEDLIFGIEQGVDFVALSFVRKPEDIRQLRKLLGKKGAGIHIIAKIEKPEALTVLDEIVEETDGIMVARGDLGIEIPAEKVPLVQKDLIKRCLDAAKPVIVATQMLDSMIRQPRATRAEISDVANAAIDHTDATMLSGESASGAFPMEAVETMAKTLQEVEMSSLDDMPPCLHLNPEEPEAAMTNVATILSHAIDAKAIVCLTETGAVARLLSRHRPPMPIYACTENAQVARQTNLTWGVIPAVFTWKNPEKWDLQVLAWLKKEKRVEAGDRVIFVGGEPLGKSGQVPWIEMRTV
ncbi:pyruvate kinase [Patescibacteria group bacterium]|nr:pyruvate kinase [Patescibacteria group bacterium]